MTMSQWKALLESNKKASSLPPTPVKAGLFTTACGEFKATRSLHLQPQPHCSTVNTAPSVSTTHDEVLSALKSNLKMADIDGYSKFSFFSGYNVPPNT